MIKIIAFATMLIDHIGQVFFPGNVIFVMIGRIAFPLFAWGISNGFKKTRNFRNYALRILLLGILSQIPHTLLFHTMNLNVGFTLLVGLLVLGVYEAKLSLALKGGAICILFAASHLLNFEYGAYGVSLILSFYFLEQKPFIMSALQSMLSVIATLIYQYNPIQLFAIFSPILVFLFRKHDFKIHPLLGYGFYPIHMILLLIVRDIILPLIYL